MPSWNRPQHHTTKKTAQHPGGGGKEHSAPLHSAPQRGKATHQKEEDNTHQCKMRRHNTKTRRSAAAPNRKQEQHPSPTTDCKHSSPRKEDKGHKHGTRGSTSTGTKIRKRDGTGRVPPDTTQQRSQQHDRCKQGRGGTQQPRGPQRAHQHSAAQPAEQGTARLKKKTKKKKKKKKQREGRGKPAVPRPRAPGAGNNTKQETTRAQGKKNPRGGAGRLGENNTTPRPKAQKNPRGPSRAPSCCSLSAQRRLARMCSVGFLTGLHARIPCAQAKRAAGLSRLPQGQAVGGGRVPELGL